MKRLILLPITVMFLACLPFGSSYKAPLDRCPVGDDMEVIFRQNTPSGVPRDILVACEVKKEKVPPKLVLDRVASCLETRYHISTNKNRAYTFEWYSNSAIVAQPLDPGYVVLGVTLPGEREVHVWKDPRNPKWPSYDAVVSHELIHVITGLGHGNQYLPEEAYEYCSITLTHQDVYDDQDVREAFVDGMLLH